MIPNGPHGYDAGCILGVVNTPVIVDNEVWLYYTAITTTHGGFVPEKKITIARAAWRLDGWVSLDAGASGGIVETVPVETNGLRLTVNAEASRGELRTELLDASGTEIPGYSPDACIPICGDGVRQPVSWKGLDGVPLPGTIRIRWHLRNASIYSHAFS